MHRFWPLLLLLLVAHGLSLRNDFAHDDRWVARAESAPGRPNAMVATLQSPAEYFTSPYWRGIDESAGLDALYRPFPVWSYALVYATAGRHLGAREAVPQHVVNLLFYALAAWLVWRLLTALGAAGTIRFVATAAFVVHPLHVEPVTAIVGRAELFAFTGGLGFVLLGMRAFANERRLGFAAMAAMALFFGLCSKESCLAFVPLAPLVWTGSRRRNDGWPAIRRQVVVDAVRALAVAALPMVVFFVLRTNALSTLPADYVTPWILNPLAELPASRRIPTALAIQGFSLGKLLVPWPLSCDYGANVFTIATSWFDLRALGVVALFVSVGVWSLRAARRDALPALAVATFVGLAMPTANLLLPIGTQFAERLCFSPSLALPLLLAALLPRVPANKMRLATGAVGLWCLLATIASVVRTTAWRDDATLYRTDAVTRPDSLLIQTNAAAVELAAGDRQARMARLRDAVAAAPDYGPAWSDLGLLLHQQNDLEGAETALRKGLAAPRRDRASDVDNAKTNLALVLADRGKLDEVLRLLDELLESSPKTVTQRLSFFFARLRSTVEPARLLQLVEKGRQHDPGPSWEMARGMLFEQTGKHLEAIDVLGKLPNDADPAFLFEARLHLAKAFAAMQRSTDAMQICREIEGDRRAPAAVKKDAAALRQRIER